jgi:hypothetical protein
MPLKRGFFSLKIFRIFTIYKIKIMIEFLGMLSIVIPTIIISYFLTKKANEITGDNEDEEDFQI